jgi:hypothetical protein
MWLSASLSTLRPRTPREARRAGVFTAVEYTVRALLGPIDIQDSHRESVLIHCAWDQLIRSAAHGEAVRAQ